MELTPLAARTFAAILEERTGQQLGGGRRWRLETALGPLLRETGCASLDALAARIAVAGEGGSALRRMVAEALLNHETSFFRDRAAFDLLRTRVLPHLRAGGDRLLRIWSAGCATGQETYSLAMLLADDAEHWRGRAVDLIGTDVSGAAIGRARAATYGKLEVQRGLAITELLRHFEQAGEGWRLRAETAARAHFAAVELLDPLPAGPFDLILCRNVLLYFDEARRRAVLARLTAALAPAGLLMLGAGETALGQADVLEPHPAFRGCYRRTGANGAGAERGDGAMPHAA